MITIETQTEHHHRNYHHTDRPEVDHLWSPRFDIGPVLNPSPCVYGNEFCLHFPYEHGQHCWLSLIQFLFSFMQLFCYLVFPLDQISPYQVNGSQDNAFSSACGLTVTVTYFHLHVVRTDTVDIMMLFWSCSVVDCWTVAWWVSEHTHTHTHTHTHRWKC